MSSNKPFKINSANQDFNFNIGTKDKNSKRKEQNNEAQSFLIEDALNLIFKQMRVTGRRPRTIESYDYIFRNFMEVTEIQYVHEINSNTLYNYIDLLDVSVATKLIRLKSVKAVLSRFFDNGLLVDKFWKNIDIKIDEEVKEGSAAGDIELLLNAIDKTTFTGFRDAVAILLMYKTGIRINTLGKLKENHINFETLELCLDGGVMKGRAMLKLPIDEQLAANLKYLIEENKKIRKFNKVDNKYVFITVKGRSINNSKSNTNVMSKRLTNYAKEYGLKNINSHAIRRGYAKNLLNEGANTALISKALGHKDLSTTTKYLHLDADEVAQNLREFL